MDHIKERKFLRCLNIWCCYFKMRTKSLKNFQIILRNFWHKIIEQKIFGNFRLFRLLVGIFFWSWVNNFWVWIIYQNTARSSFINLKIFEIFFSYKIRKYSVFYLLSLGQKMNTFVTRFSIYCERKTGWRPQNYIINNNT